MKGQTIFNHRILDKLGESCMRVVYKAEDISLQRAVALNFLSTRLTGADQAPSRLLREARAAAALSHPTASPSKR